MGGHLTAHLSRQSRRYSAIRVFSSPLSVSPLPSSPSLSFAGLSSVIPPHLLSLLEFHLQCQSGTFAQDPMKSEVVFSITSSVPPLQQHVPSARLGQADFFCE